MDSLTDEIFISNYETLEKQLSKIPLDKRVGLVVMLNNVKYEFLINIKSDSDSLICLGPSGLPDKNAIKKFKNRPMFTRHSWNFKESVLLYNDNTRYVWDGSGAGWGLGLPDDYFLENIKNIILKISDFFKIRNENLLFYGSSMGGFTSVQLATMIRNSSAIAENPQIDARKWMKNFYVKNGMLSKLYEDKTLAKFKPYTYSIIEMIKKENYIPNLTIIHDISQTDIQQYLSEFINNLHRLPFKKDDFHKVNIVIEPIKTHTPIPQANLYELFNIHNSIKRKDYLNNENYDDITKSIPLIKKLGLFDEKYYAHNYKEIGELDPLTHYLIKGWKEGKNPSEEFDNNFYLKKYAGVNDIGLNPLIHYVLYGNNEGRIKNEKEELERIQKDIPLVKKSKLFNEYYYYKQCNDLGGMTPIEHYLVKGWLEGKNPSRKFHNDGYLEMFPAIRKMGINPLIHHIKYNLKKDKQ